MTFFQDVVHGPYAFLLVLQVLIVSGLLLTLVWFLIDKARGTVGGISEVPAIADPAPKPEQPVSVPVPAAVIAEAPKAEEVVAVEASAPAAAPEPVPAVAAVKETMADAATEALAETQKELNALLEESKGLKDKIKYLESRLMEYEIVQEEISALSVLRNENERLKEEFTKAGMKIPQAPAPAPAAPAAPSAPASAEASAAAAQNVTPAQITNLLEKIDDISTKT